MATARRLILVDCRRCGHNAERVRRTDDNRSIAHLQEFARCGACYARACDGALHVALAERAAPDRPSRIHPARPGFIVEPDGELHPRSRRKGGGKEHQPRLEVVPNQVSGPGARPPSGPRPPHPLIRAIYADPARNGGVLVGLFAVVLVSLLIAGAVKVIGFAGERAFHYATAPGARERTYDFSDPMERSAYCFGREYLIHVRGADVPENVRELRRSVIRHCPDLAARR